MKTNPTVSRFVGRANITIHPNTQAKVDDDGDTYNYTRISTDHYACVSGDTTYIIIEKDGKIGCSCADMKYRCTGNKGCKHIAKFIELDVPPQLPASIELIEKLMIMGWVGGKDNLRPTELLKPVAPIDDPEDPISPAPTAHYKCPKCGKSADTDQEKLAGWILNHLDTCQGNESPAPSPAIKKPPATTDVAPDTEVSIIPDIGDTDTIPLPPTTGEQMVGQTCQPITRNLATALCNMQKIDLLAVADSSNPFHNSKYADLASVWAAIRKPLTDNGLAVIQTIEPYQDGVTVVTTLLHTSGETFTTRMSYGVPGSKPDKNGQIKPNIQGLGSTITYLRRYSLAAMTGVAPVDDDGEAAMGRTDYTTM